MTRNIATLTKMNGLFRIVSCYLLKEVRATHDLHKLLQMQSDEVIYVRRSNGN